MSDNIKYKIIDIHKEELISGDYFSHENYSNRKKFKLTSEQISSVNKYRLDEHDYHKEYYFFRPIKTKKKIG